MDISHLKYKTRILCLLLSLSFGKSNKNEDYKRIGLPCRHVNYIKC